MIHCPVVLGPLGRIDLLKAEDNQLSLFNKFNKMSHFDRLEIYLVNYVGAKIKTADKAIVAGA